MVPIRERQIFEAMKSSLNIEDNPRSTKSLKFSWDNLRSDGSRCLARLDRMYLFNSHPSSERRQLLHYSIRGDMTCSDHHPVITIIQFEDRPRRASKWKMSSALLDKAFVEISDRWKIAASFFTKLHPILKYYKEFCKNRAAASRADEDTLKAELEAATSFLQDHGDDAEAQARQGEARTCLEQFQARRIASRKIRNRLRWKLKGDLVSLKFFLATKELSQTATITFLKNEAGVKVSECRGLEQLVTSSYSQLYSAPAKFPAQAQAEERIL
jgi:hypothetical protein